MAFKSSQLLFKHSAIFHTIPSSTSVIIIPPIFTKVRKYWKCKKKKKSFQRKKDNIKNKLKNRKDGTWLGNKINPRLCLLPRKPGCFPYYVHTTAYNAHATRLRRNSALKNIWVNKQWSWCSVYLLKYLVSLHLRRLISFLACK